MSSKISNKMYNKLNSRKNLQIRPSKNNSSKFLDKQYLFIHTRDSFDERSNQKIETLPYIFNKGKKVSSQKILTTQENKNFSDRFFSPKNLQFNRKLKILPSDKELQLNIENTITKKSHKNLLYVHKPNSKITQIKYNNKSTSKFPLVNNNKCPISEDKNDYPVKAINKKISPIKKPQKLWEFSPGGKKFSTESKTGIEEDGKPKENNQDTVIVIEKVCDFENYDIIAVMDGHGTNGHLVSNFVKNKINEYFNNKKLFKHKHKNNHEISDNEKLELEQKIIYEKLSHNNYEIINNFFKKVNDELYEAVFDIHFSGCTCIIIFKLKNKIICSNVGDSRAILFKKNNFIELSHDHKPNLPSELKRIMDMGGCVSRNYLDEDNEEEINGIFRVWKKGCSYPGIAISRSLGDRVAELIGVTYEPEILEFNLDDSCEYIVCGSDGIWEYLSNEEVGEMVKKYLRTKNGDEACFDLVERATSLWKEKEERVDDITVCIYFL